jgi:hypothetical protein
MEVAERAQKAGMGDIGRVMRWVLWGCDEQLADDLAEVQCRNKKEGKVVDDAAKRKGTTRGFTLKNRRQSTTSTIGIRPGSMYDSDISEETGKLLHMSDSEGETSEAEWHGWMADLHRQQRVQDEKEREAAEAALHRSEDDDAEKPHPKNQAEDQRRYREERRALEPHAVVTTASISASTATSSGMHSFILTLQYNCSEHHHSSFDAVHHTLFTFFVRVSCSSSTCPGAELLAC